MKLKDIARYVTDKVSSDAIGLENYVTTDSILQNKAGRVKASNLPPTSCTLTRFQKGDILIANIRPYLRKIWLADIDGGCNADVLVFRAINGYSSAFVYAVLMQDSFYIYAMKGAKGSKMPRGDKEQIMRFEVPSNLQDTDEIGYFIVAIKAKIDLLNQINRNLEAIARQLYDYWFVQFDFPDENGRSYKSSGGKMVWNEKLKREIPDGWEVVNLFDGVEVQYGFPFSTELFVEDETAIPVVRIRDILNGTTSAFSTEIADSKYKLAKGDLLIGMDGNFHMNLWSDDKAYLNQRSVRIRRKEDNQISALQVLFEIAPYIKAKEQNAKGSTVGHLSDKDLKGIWLLSPSSNTHFVPALTFGNIAAKLISNRNEIAALTAQRDELLPLLMNGQVSVRPRALNCDLSHD